MASANRQLSSVSCPGCSAQYQFPASMAGRRGKCASCGTEFAVPRPPTATAPNIATVANIFEEDEQDSPPQYIPVECRVCQTRIYGRPHQVGQKLKCPDCGAQNVVPPPPQPKRKKTPAALEGEQYELYDPDVQPLPSALIAKQPKFIAVKCSKCDTMMYATEKQAGQTIVCPDCGRKCKVPMPAKPKPARSVLATDAETPRLDPAFEPFERPPAVSPETLQKIEAELDDTPYGRALAESRRTGKPLTVDPRGRPILPRWPLITGVWRMLVTEEVIARWILLSIVLGLAGQFLGEALLTPIQGQAEAIKLIFTVIGGVLAAAWMAMAAPFMVAIVGESSDGHDRVNQPPRLMAFDWFGELFSVTMAGSLAGLCGMGAWQLARLSALGPVISAVIVVAVVIVVLPVALLSTLVEGAPLAVLSPRIVSSFGRCAGAWLQFYVQTFALAAVVGGAAWFLWLWRQPLPGEETILIWFLGPLAIAALFIDMRLLGRLAWWISETMPEKEMSNES